MTFLWIALGVLLLVVVVITLTDIVRRGGPIWGAIGWAVLVVVLPFLGSIIYWALRKPEAAELERERMVQEDLRRSRADGPFDSTGMRR
jgi:type VI protein secretion system component VasK